MQAIDNLPLWGFFLIVLIASIFWSECGYRFALWRLKSGLQESQAALGTIVASILGLLAFMLAFTFNVALTRFDDRRAGVLDEANAIGTAYLRADFFDEPQKGQIKKILREYVQERWEGLEPGTAFNQVIVKSEALQDQLWAIGANLARTHQGSPMYALFVSSVNEVIDIHTKRVTLCLHARVPQCVWAVLLIISFLSMMAVGYYCGITGNRGRAETLILIVIFATVMLLVVDLDRPFEGFINTDQQPLIDLHQKLGPP